MDTPPSRDHPSLGVQVVLCQRRDWDSLFVPQGTAHPSYRGKQRSGSLEDKSNAIHKEKLTSGRQLALLQASRRHPLTLIFLPRPAVQAWSPGPPGKELPLPRSLY